MPSVRRLALGRTAAAAPAVGGTAVEPADPVAAAPAADSVLDAVSASDVVLASGVVSVRRR